MADNPATETTQAAARSAEERPVEKKGLLAAFSSLKVRDFRYLWLGQVGSATAMHSDIVARSWLTWELTGSTVAVALVNVMRSVPMLGLGLFGGVIADRFDKRKTLLFIQAWTLLIYLAMAIVVLTGVVELWHVYTYAFLIGVGFALNQPVRTSFVPQLVDRAHLLNALTLNSIAINSTRLLGPAAIGFLIVFAGGVGPAYAVSAAFYTVVVLSTLQIRPRPVQADQRARGSMVGQLLEGFQYLGKNRLVLALVVLGLGPLAFGHSYITMLPAFSEQVLNRGADGVGIIPSVAAIGGLAGGLVIASRGNIPHKGRLMLLAGMIYGAALMAMSLVHVLWMVFPIVIIIGASQTTFRASNNSTILEAAPDRMHGRMISVTMMDTALGPVAALAGGVVADQYGVAAGIFFIGAVCAVIVLAVGVIVPAVRRI
ncbi:MAG: MFS transporter [SAR202 cluster bacterium]|nr:MFS transporter [SAR202 cluster bacterium]